MKICDMSANALTKPIPFGHLAHQYDGVLCDIWGVLHNGVAAFDAAVDALRRYRASGGHVVLITNAPRSSREIYPQLERFGIRRDAFDTIVTSGDVTGALITKTPDAPLFHFGPPRDISALENLTNPIVELSDAEICLLTGPLNDTIETVACYEDELVKLRDNSVQMICANPDLFVRSGNRTVICAGSIAQRYVELGGTVVFAGKPEAAIYDMALGRMIDIAGRDMPKSRILAIGDGLPTDIKGSADNGFDAYFITGGIHAAELGDICVAANLAKAVEKVRSRHPQINLVGVCECLRWK